MQREVLTRNEKGRGFINTLWKNKCNSTNGFLSFCNSNGPQNFPTTANMDKLDEQMCRIQTTSALDLFGAVVAPLSFFYVPLKPFDRIKPQICSYGPYLMVVFV